MTEPIEIQLTKLIRTKFTGPEGLALLTRKIAKYKHKLGTGKAEKINDLSEEDTQKFFDELSAL